MKKKAAYRKPKLGDELDTGALGDVAGGQAQSGATCGKGERARGACGRGMLTLDEACRSGELTSSHCTSGLGAQERERPHAE